MFSMRVPSRSRAGVFASANTPAPQSSPRHPRRLRRCPRCGQSARRRALTKQSPPKPLAASSSLGAAAGELAQTDDGGIYLPWCCSENYFWFGFSGYTPAVVSTDCPWRRAVREVIGKVLSRNLFELRDGSAQRVLRRLAVAFSSGNSRRSGARGLLGAKQDSPLTRLAGETAGSPPAPAGHALAKQP